MHRIFLCFLLCLMPLRLWAGAWMPVVQGGSHHAAVVTSVSSTQHAQADEGHDCHEAMAASAPEAHATHAVHAQPTAQADPGGQNADCHDGTCQLCGVCHQSVSLTAWPLVLPVFQAHPLPVGASLAHLARTAPPLIKPPIS